MKLLLIVLRFCALFHSLNSEDWFTSSEDNKKTVRIERIKVFGEPHFMQVYTHIHDDRKYFDIYISIFRKLGSNYLIMNFNLRLKSEGATEFRKIIEVKRFDLCKFLIDPLLQTLFTTMILECPIRVGNYSIIRVDTDNVMNPYIFGKGTYKFFAEVVETTGDVPKVFAIQVMSSKT